VRDGDARHQPRSRTPTCGAAHAPDASRRGADDRPMKADRIELEPAHRGLRWWIFTLAILALACAASLTARELSRRRSPLYALDRIRIALEQHDKSSFYEFVDLDASLAAATQDVAAFVASRSTERDPVAGFLYGFGVGLGSAMIGSAAKVQLDRFLESGTGSDVGLPALVLGAIERGRVEGSRVDGQIVVVQFSVDTPYERRVTLMLKLRPKDGHLRLVEVGNLSHLLAELDVMEQVRQTAKEKEEQEVQRKEVAAGWQDDLRKVLHHGTVEATGDAATTLEFTVAECSASFLPAIRNRFASLREQGFVRLECTNDHGKIWSEDMVER
jgi:hypothetical protein